MSETLGTCGTVLIVVGCYLVHPSLAFVVSGCAMLFVGVTVNLRTRK